jgi:hypothetical protein
MFTHLQMIDEQSIATSWPGKRVVWHYFWARLFDLIDIGRSEIFLRAKIIHYVQSIATFIMIFYVSKIILRNLFKQISTVSLNYLGYWSAIIWMTVFSNASVYHMQVWMIWYSINYQITLPITLLATALTVSLIFEGASRKIKLVKAFFIVLLLYIVLRVHAMEFIYYLMYTGVLILLFLDKILGWCRKHLYLSIFGTLFIVYTVTRLVTFIQKHTYRNAPIFEYLSFDKLPSLLDRIRFEGQALSGYYNKVDYIMNELIYLSIAAAFIFVFIATVRYYKNYRDQIELRLVFFLFLTSLFVFIPVFTITAGIASLLTYNWISYRFYYSSLLFLALPGFVYYLFSLWRIKHIWVINITLFLILGTTFLYSKFNISNRQNYYRNVISIKNAFDEKKMGFNLSHENIVQIGQKLKEYEAQNKTGKPEFYYARDDIAFVIKFVYQKPVLYTRRGTVNYIKSYHKHKDIDYVPVLFEVPENFPEYRRFQ